MRNLRGPNKIDPVGASKPHPTANNLATLFLLSINSFQLTINATDLRTLSLWLSTVRTWDYSHVADLRAIRQFETCRYSRRPSKRQSTATTLHTNPLIAPTMADNASSRSFVSVPPPPLPKDYPPLQRPTFPPAAVKQFSQGSPVRRKPLPSNASPVVPSPASPESVEQVQSATVSPEQGKTNGISRALDFVEKGLVN